MQRYPLDTSLPWGLRGQPDRDGPLPMSPGIMALQPPPSHGSWHQPQPPHPGSPCRVSLAAEKSASSLAPVHSYRAPDPLPRMPGVGTQTPS